MLKIRHFAKPRTVTFNLKTDDTYFLKSKGRRYFRIGLALAVSVIFLFYGISDESTGQIVIAAAIAFSVFIELIIHEMTTIELTQTELKVNVSKLSGTLNDKYKIPLSEIQSRHYEKKTHDKGMLWIYILWELYFPTNKSHLIIHKDNGRTLEIPLNVTDQEAKNLLSKLPERIPNK